MKKLEIFCRHCKNHCKTTVIWSEDGNLLRIENNGCPAGVPYIRRVLLNPDSMPENETGGICSFQRGSADENSQ